MPKFTVHLIAPMQARAEIEIEAPTEKLAEDQALGMVDAGKVKFKWDDPDLDDAWVDLVIPLDGSEEGEK